MWRENFYYTTNKFNTLLKIIRDLISNYLDDIDPYHTEESKHIYDIATAVDIVKTLALLYIVDITNPNKDNFTLFKSSTCLSSSDIFI